MTATEALWTGLVFAAVLNGEPILHIVMHLKQIYFGPSLRTLRKRQQKLEDKINKDKL